MIESEYWAPHAPEDFVAVAVHTGTGARFAHEVYADKGITYPQVYDLDQRLFLDYAPRAAGVSPFPLHYLIGRDGRIVDVAAELPVEAWGTSIAELVDEAR